MSTGGNNSNEGNYGPYWCIYEHNGEYYVTRAQLSHTLGGPYRIGAPPMHLLNQPRPNNLNLQWPQPLPQPQPQPQVLPPLGLFGIFVRIPNVVRPQVAAPSPAVGFSNPTQQTNTPQALSVQSRRYRRFRRQVQRRAETPRNARMSNGQGMTQPPPEPNNLLLSTGQELRLGDNNETNSQPSIPIGATPEPNNLPPSVDLELRLGFPSNPTNNQGNN